MSGYRVPLRDRIAYQIARIGFKIASPEYRAFAEVVCDKGTKALRGDLANAAAEQRYRDMTGMDDPSEVRADRARRNSERVEPLSRKTWLSDREYEVNEDVPSDLPCFPMPQDGHNCTLREGHDGPHVCCDGHQWHSRAETSARVSLDSGLTEKEAAAIVAGARTGDIRAPLPARWVRRPKAES